MRIFKFILPVVALLFPVFAFTVPAFAQNACNTNTAIYGTPGNYTFTVPAGVTQIRSVVVGAGGGGGAGSGGWGSGGGGGCGGALSGGTMAVTPGQKISLFVGYGGSGGNGTSQTGAGGCPWCGTYNPSSDGSSGGSSSIAGVTAVGGSWGRTGYQNLYNQHPGGFGGGSGGGGGGNGWPGYQAVVGSGGTAGGQTNSQGAGGYCTGDGWSIDPGTYITKVSWTAGQGGQEPAVNSYYGGGGGGGLVVNGSTVNGETAPGGCPWGCPGTGGQGYGGGGGGQGLDYQGAGGSGASGLVYIEWDGGDSSSCALSCKITFDQNPLKSASTKIHWSSSNASLFYINNIGYVSGSGVAQVSAPGDYSGSVSGIGSVASCPATLSDGNAILCPDGSQAANGDPKQCTCGQGNINKCSSNLCPDGSQAANGDPNQCTCLQGNVSKCKLGSYSCNTSNQCVAIPNGQYGNSGCNGACGRICTPTSTTCQASGNLRTNCGTETYCEFGCSTATNQCNTQRSCQRTPVCDAEGNKVVNACDNSTLDDCASRGLVCIAGACRTPKITFVPFDATRTGKGFGATGHLQALPALVASGEVTHLYWNLTHVSNCSVTGSNGDNWSSLFSGATGQTSGAITEKTSFSLHCDSSPEAEPATVDETVMVNMLPTFKEK